MLFLKTELKGLYLVVQLAMQLGYQQSLCLKKRLLFTMNQINLTILLLFETDIVQGIFWGKRLGVTEKGL